MVDRTKLEEATTWYWVTPVDDVDALGDYGGFTFQTRQAAEEFIHDEYAEWFRLQREGYYDAEASPSLLQIETVLTVKTEILDAVRDEIFGGEG